jgi:hypothetical protein
MPEELPSRHAFDATPYHPAISAWAPSSPQRGFDRYFDHDGSLAAKLRPGTNVGVWKWAVFRPSGDRFDRGIVDVSAGGLHGALACADAALVRMRQERPALAEEAPPTVAALDAKHRARLEQIQAVAAAAAVRGRLLVVPTERDALFLRERGFAETVAVPVGDLTVTAAEQLGIFGPVFLHLDHPVQHLGYELARRFLAAGVDVRHVETGREDVHGLADLAFPATGPADLERALASAEPLMVAVIDRLVERNAPDALPIHQERAFHKVCGCLRRLPPDLLERAVGKAAGVLGIDAEVIRAFVEGRGPSPFWRERWFPGEDLARLLHLLVHFPAEVGPLVAPNGAALPLAERPTALRVIERLARAEELAVVAEDAGDDRDLAGVLRALGRRAPQTAQEQVVAEATRLIGAILTEVAS